MSALQVRLFGRLSMCYDGQRLPPIGSGKVEELLCYLLLHRSKPCLREWLASLLWENNTTAQAKAYLRRAIWQLQNALKTAQPAPDDGFVQAQGDWVQCNPAFEVWVDVETFEAAYTRTEGISGAALDAAAAAELEEAVNLYEGDLLEHCYQDWCLYERERFRHLYLVMLDKVVEHHEAVRRYEHAIALAERVLAYDPARERTHRQLMRLHHESGNRSAALRQYRLCEDALRNDFDVAPGAATSQLYEVICRGQAVLGDGEEPELPDLPELLLQVDALPASETAPQALQRTLRVLTQIREQVQQEIDYLERQNLV